MDKKVGVSILFGFLLLVGLVVTNAIVDSADSSTDMLRSANITLYGNSPGVENSTSGGTSEIVNLTVTAGAGGLDNITNITVTWDANFTFTGWADEGTNEGGSACTSQPNGIPAECADLDDGFGGDGNVTFNNVTFLNNDPAIKGNWSCANFSTTSINCYNSTAFDALSSSGNTSITIKFNVTAASSVEDKSIFLINATNSEASLNGNNQTSLTVYIDGVAPRLVELNISDGNTTWDNGTFNGTIGAGVASFLSNDSDLTVTATVYEQTPDQAATWLFYNGSNIGFTGQQDLLLGKVEVSPTITVGALANVDASTHSHAIKYSWTIAKNAVENFGVGTGNTSIAFLLLLNDTYNREIASNDSSTVNDNGPYSVILNNTLPFVYNITFTDGNGNVLAGGDQADASSDFLAAVNVTIKIGVSGSPKPSSSELSNSSAIYIYYNTTGSMTSSTNGEIIDYDTLINLTDANISIIENTTIGSPEDVVSYETSINLGGNASNNVNVYVVLGNKTEDLTLPTETGAGNYSSEALFRFTVDGAEPSAELNTPTSRGLSTSDSIEYTCTGSDGQSGIAKYTWFLQKPGDAFTQISETSTSSGTNKQTFSGTQIGSAGTYNVRCRVTDAVGNSKDIETNTLNKFTVSISSTGDGSAATGGGGGAGAAVSFDVDFTTSPQATFKASQGRVKSFSFDGTTKHTITFNEVTANSVTLIIASNPITVLLNAGQSKSVDINNDGTNDMKVQLNGVENGVADVTVTKIEEGAAKIKAEEEQARGTTETGEEREVTPVAGRSLAWLWWTLIVIVAIVAIGYYVNKRK